MNPILTHAPEYPFTQLLELKRQREQLGKQVIDFGMGDPREPTPAFLREALRAAVPEISSYPTVRGSASLRRAIAQYLARRFGLAVDPERHVLPVNGTKEGIFTSHLAFLDPRSDKRTVVTFEPSYPVYAAGAEYAGGKLEAIPLRAANGYRPEPDELSRALLDRTQLMWVNYPHNPTGAEAPVELYRRLVELARRHDFILASDECYSDICFGTPSPTALAARDAPGFENVLAFHSCSKRSAMTGYRSGFVVGDPDLIDALAKFRPSVGVATPSFVQAVAEKAWSDDEHARAMADTYRRRRDLFRDLFERRGWHHDGGNATFYLWWRVPEGCGDDVALARKLLELDILVTPGSYLGERSGREASHVRLALVAGEAQCREAVRRLEAFQP